MRTNPTCAAIFQTCLRKRLLSRTRPTRWKDCSNCSWTRKSASFGNNKTRSRHWDRSWEMSNAITHQGTMKWLRDLELQSGKGMIWEHAWPLNWEIIRLLEKRCNKKSKLLNFKEILTDNLSTKNWIELMKSIVRKASSKKTKWRLNWNVARKRSNSLSQ